MGVWGVCGVVLTWGEGIMDILYCDMGGPEVYYVGVWEEREYYSGECGDWEYIIVGSVGTGSILEWGVWGGSILERGGGSLWIFEWEKRGLGACYCGEGVG